MNIVAESATRVTANTAAQVNQRIVTNTRDRMALIGNDPQAITERLRELDLEWDIERAIEANAAGFALTGTVLGLTVHRGFMALPLVVTAFLLQHAIQGWCPPVPLLRRMGFRTAREIEDERHGLLARQGGTPLG